MKVLEPRVSRRERKLHLSYELSNRIHCSRIYPLLAPNGSTILLYGHDRGLRVLWRGGKRPKEPKPQQPAPKVNGVGKQPEVILIDSDDEQPQPQPQPQQNHVEDEYEEEGGDQDLDCPYPSIIQELTIDFNTDVLHLAIPHILSTSGASQVPAFARTHIIVAVTCSDSTIRLVTMPLRPPKFATKQDYYDQEVKELQFGGSGTVTRDLDIKLMMQDDRQLLEQHHNASNMDGQLLLAAVGSSVNIWTLDLGPDGILNPHQAKPAQISSTISACAVSLPSTSSQNLILLVDSCGTVHIYEPGTSSSIRRASSRDSAPAPHNDSQDMARRVMSFHTPFFSPKGNPVLARRKKILAAKWVLGARGILVLLEDREWGLWDLYGPSQSGKSMEDFALRGYLDSSGSATEIADPGKQRKARAKLAPMTPNTRKAKSENLFSGIPKPAGVAPSGGISVATSGTHTGQTDDSVIMWYGSEIYSIQSIQTFWQRNGNNTSGFGSLYAPGLTHITDINLMNENITSISQFASTSSASSLDQMNLQKDLLVSAEHRVIILQSLRPPTAARQLFQQTVDRPASRDQTMLDAGELDLGGMDRMLDSMTGPGRTRRVGFAS